MLTRLEWADYAQRVTERLKAGPADQGFAYVAIGLAASAFLTFPVAVQLLKPRKPHSLEPVAVPKDIESSLVIQVSAQKRPPDISRICAAHTCCDVQFSMTLALGR